MSRTESEPTGEKKNFYYAVLNLNRAASQSEINERHRALSLIFHPDKQQDEAAKVIATKKFLEIQKAYQVLSDPFLRQVYDTLGEQGLSVRWSPEVRSKSVDEVERIIGQVKGDTIYKELDEKIRPRGTVVYAVDATSLVGPYLGPTDDGLSQKILNSFGDLRVMNSEVQYSIQESLSDQTTLSLKSRLSYKAGRVQNKFTGTLRHQFSPRFTSEIDIGLLRPHSIRVGGTYTGNATTVVAQASCMLAALGILPPTFNVSMSRRLFRARPETAAFELNLGSQPHFVVNLISPSMFGFKPAHGTDGSSERQSPPSVSGLEFGTTHRMFGLSFESFFPKLVAEWGVTFTELALQLKLGLQYGLEGLSWVCSGTWSSPTTSFTAATHLNVMGVVLSLELLHLQQQIKIPIILSVDYEPRLALWTVFLPSTALALSYHFVLKPRRRRQRLRYIRAARRALEEESDIRRERDAVTSLLKDTARRLTSAETSKGGLVITEATYGSVEKEDGASDLIIDVTVPLQALVRNSQLYVAADQPKSGIQGFTDPAPSTNKVLCIRYLFCGQTHYAEFPDDVPVVLPLAEHVIQ
ncbi:DnaJ subfamily C member 11 [Hypsizygus marmoreus]|uniref:DnaJ subfamily C member 11 n=1 Tax=Hypsizygus marmoreus TaxID=39966 RepID=A0A369KEU6_HYPMA|nr:DnaJ subfamily C member 11 [Hypsizygus marmoreus]